MNEDIKEEIAAMEPPVATRAWTLTWEGETKTYQQKPLTFFRKLEFFALLGDTVERITKDDGEKGVQVSQLLGGATQTDNLVLVISKLAGQSPELLKNCYSIWLNIPADERTWAYWAMEELSDDEGMLIIETFVDQNADSIKDFFGPRGQKLFNKAAKKFGLTNVTAAGSESSKPSKPTVRRTKETV